MRQLIVGCRAHVPTDSNERRKSWSDDKIKKKDLYRFVFNLIRRIRRLCFTFMFVVGTHAMRTLKLRKGKLETQVFSINIKL